MKLVIILLLNIQNQYCAFLFCLLIKLNALNKNAMVTGEAANIGQFI